MDAVGFDKLVASCGFVEQAASPGSRDEEHVGEEE